MLRDYVYSIYIDLNLSLPSNSEGFDHVAFLDVHMSSHVIWEKVHQVCRYASLSGLCDDIIATKRVFYGYLLLE